MIGVRYSIQSWCCGGHRKTLWYGNEDLTSKVSINPYACHLFSSTLLLRRCVFDGLPPKKVTQKFLKFYIHIYWKTPQVSPYVPLTAEYFPVGCHENTILAWRYCGQNDWSLEKVRNSAIWIGCIEYWITMVHKIPHEISGINSG